MAEWYEADRSGLADDKKSDLQRKDLEGIRWLSKMPVGTIFFRLLPAYNQRGTILKKLYRHRWQYDGKWNWLCPQHMYKQSCPICEAEEWLATNGYDVNLKPEFRCATNMVIYGGPAGFEFIPYLPYVSLMPWNWFQSCRDWLLEPSLGKIEDVTNGVYLMGTREGSGLSTKYSISMMPNRGPIAPEAPLVEQIKNHIYDLDKIWSEPDANYHAVLTAIATAIKTHHMGATARNDMRTADSVPGAIFTLPVPGTPSAPVSPVNLVPTPVSTPIPTVPTPVVPAAPVNLVPPPVAPTTPIPSVPITPIPVASPKAVNLVPPPSPAPEAAVATPAFTQPTAAPAVNRGTKQECFGKGHDAKKVQCVLCPDEPACAKAA